MTQTAHPLQTHWDTALKAKASDIRLIALDVDGIMSDGRLYFSASGDELKAFNILDGLGLKQLMQAGITVAVITGRRSPLTEKRMSDLGIPHLMQGREDKKVALLELIRDMNLEPEQIAYMGDDIIDIPVLRRVGLSACVPEAPDEVRREVDMITRNRGGDGAAAEFIEFILREAGHWPGLMERYQR